MRLLNTHTLKLEEFLDENRVEYAILSHTWGTDEVLFSDIGSPDQARTKDGFVKVQKFCTTAATAGFNYGWIDTCCIDKSSTTELSEAINSMFRWYQRAAVCYVYLSDVYNEGCPSQFAESRWFTRGWTLQELLAPQKLIFFDVDWVEIGVKDQMIEQVSNATGISEQAIKSLNINDFCVAERMSWAANRVTTRPEDIAYSLLGLFGVSMPMLFGVGKQKAFISLQEQILKESDDRTIFGWSGFTRQFTGVLAESPALFKSCTMMANRTPLGAQVTVPHMLTNLGLSIEVCIWPVAYKTYLMAINPPRDSDISAQDHCIFLRWISDAGQYVRTQYQGKQVYRGTAPTITDSILLSTNGRLLRRPCITKQIIIQQRLLDLLLWHVYTQTPDATPAFHLEMAASCHKQAFNIAEVIGIGQWDPKANLLKLSDNHMGTAGIFTLNHSGAMGKLHASWPRKILLGFGFSFFPVCIIMTEKASKVCKNTWTSSSKPHKLPSNISQTKMEDITCFETRGWSTVSDNVIHEIDSRPGAWFVKLDSYNEFYGTFGKKNNWYLRIKLEFADGFGDVRAAAVEAGNNWEWRVKIGDTRDFVNEDQKYEF